MDVHPEAWFCPHSQDTFLKFNSSTTISLAEKYFYFGCMSNATRLVFQECL